jgi:hypothetical protein
MWEEKGPFQYLLPAGLWESPTFPLLPAEVKVLRLPVLQDRTEPPGSGVGLDEQKPHRFVTECCGATVGVSDPEEAPSRVVLDLRGGPVGLAEVGIGGDPGLRVDMDERGPRTGVARHEPLRGLRFIPTGMG